MHFFLAVVNQVGTKVSNNLHFKLYYKRLKQILEKCKNYKHFKTMSKPIKILIICKASY